MEFFRPEYFIHAANVLLLIAYSVRDVLWLRLFAVAASVIAIPFYVIQPTVLWAPLGWSVVFAAAQHFDVRNLMDRAAAHRSQGRQSDAARAPTMLSEAPRRRRR